MNLSDKWGINKMILLHRVTESFAILTKRDMCKGQVLHYMHHSRPLHLTNWGQSMSKTTLVWFRWDIYPTKLTIVQHLYDQDFYSYRPKGEKNLEKRKGLIYRGFLSDEVCHGAIPRLGLATGASKLRSPPRGKASWFLHKIHLLHCLFLYGPFYLLLSVSILILGCTAWTLVLRCL